MEGQTRAPKALGAATRDPSSPGTPGPLSTLAEQDPEYRPQPHRPLLTSSCLSLRLYHNLSRRSRHSPSHFSPQLAQPPPKASADSTASQAQHVTSGQGSTAFPARACCELAGADGLPELAGGAWTLPEWREQGSWGAGALGRTGLGDQGLALSRGMLSRLWTPLRAHPRPGEGSSPDTPAGRPSGPESEDALNRARALKYPIVLIPSPGTTHPPPSRLRFPDLCLGPWRCRDYFVIGRLKGTGKT
nr:uncharacterized protein LOC117974864 [Pan paniscus]